MTRSTYIFPVRPSRHGPDGVASPHFCFGALYPAPASPCRGQQACDRGGRSHAIALSPGRRVMELPGTKLLPGLIDLRLHVLLHPCNETPWDDQVLREAWGETVARATVHRSRTRDAGFTTLRDLGTEGAGSSDVGLRSPPEKGVIRGPRLVVAEQAIVMRGSYALRGFAPEVRVPVAAELAGNASELVSIVRAQIACGADVIKAYAGYRWGPGGSAQPAFTIEELQAAVAVANFSGRPVTAHASTAEGTRRATRAVCRRSNTAMEALPRCSRSCGNAGWSSCPLRRRDTRLPNRAAGALALTQSRRVFAPNAPRFASRSTRA